MRLRPHRSLSAGNFRLLLVCVACASSFVTLPFFLIGAWPIIGFMGLDVLLFYLAFRANFRAARAYEDVTLTAVELQIAKVSARGTRAEWRFNPAWVRLEREEHEAYGICSLALVSRGHRLEIAKFLGPDQKAQFAELFTRALDQARRGPQFS
ncbi:MAG TPA: DUF2244 domain-containing protein [Beijerinckiaceae bacterium]|jgi:uncharacterized membrane protein|nr:DUF2244 domain-containing protein [Beijerinckiaceae bacterium]